MAYGDEMDLDDELCWACRQVNDDECDVLERVRELLAAGASPNSTQSSDGYRALGLASEWSPAIVETLLEAGADARFGDMHDGSAPLVYAAMAGNVECAALLLAHGAEPNGHLNGRPQGDTPPLLCAVFSGERAVEMTELLLDAAANPNAPRCVPDWSNDQSEGETALHRAARVSDGPTAARLCALLIERGADHKACDKIGRTALHSCAEYGTEQAAQALIDFGADPTKRDDHGFSPASRARLRDNDKPLGVLISAEERADLERSEITPSATRGRARM